MSVKLNIAVANACDQPLIQAGAARVGVLHNLWPFLPGASKVVEGKVIAFAKSLYDNPTPLAVDFDELADYLVLSTCCHAFDSWRYLSQATLALLSGARNHALHFAYYAELRAALSILSGSGIGILNDKHFALTAGRTVDWFEGNTHATAWKALREWAKIPANAMKVIECFQALGMSAREWAEACNAASSLDAIAAYWLNNWSIDIKQLRKDSGLRNEATYRPDLRSSALDQVTHSEVEFIQDVNSAYIPVGGGRFESVDLIVINDLCQKACKLRYGDLSNANMHKLWNEIFTWMLRHKQIARKDAARRIRTIRDATKLSGGGILTSADTTNRTALGVISRAMILLRLATALKRRQWEDIRLAAASGGTAWQHKVVSSYGACANLWDASNPPADYGVLDADRVAAQDDMENWLAVNVPFNAYKMWRDLSGVIFDLCRFERVGVLAVSL